MKLTNTLGTALLVIAVFFISYTLFIMLSPQLHGLMSYYLPDIRSEYTVTEQLSKYYLFLMMLISMIGYTKSVNLFDIKVSLGYLGLSIVMYLSESNMISSSAQPIFALLIVVNMLRYFFLTKNWVVALFYCAGFGFLFVGVVLDFVHDIPVVNDIIPTIIVDVLKSIGEESADTFGQLLLCISIALYYRMFIFEACKKGGALIAALLLSSAFITYGNSVMHWQYYPPSEIFLSSLVITLIGLIGFLVTNKYLGKRHAEITLLTPDGAHLTIALVCLILPTTFGRVSSVSSLIVWFPVLCLYINFLWQKHPIKIVEMGN